MAKDELQSILFVQDPAQTAEELRGRGVYVCEMPLGITSVTELHEALARGLAFPECFGRNWDALDELLSDLGWLKNRETAIVHFEVPALERSDLRLYFRIVREAACEVGADGRRLTCVLPDNGDWVRDLLTAHVEDSVSVN